jgi:hypothetical protein
MKAFNAHYALRNARNEAKLLGKRLTKSKAKDGKEEGAAAKGGEEA